MKRTIISLLILIITLSVSLLPAQDQKVTYLKTKPVIDGKLDKALQNLPVRSFTFLDKSDKGNADTVANYRIAYGFDYLYLFIESDQDSIDARDRGYQNGDGFIVTIASPKSDNQPANRFYVLSFTPTNKFSSKWQRNFVWYKNIEVAFYQLEKTNFKETCANGRAGFEVMIPWEELYPYHPGLKEIGFNLCYVRALPELKTNYHYALYDDKIQNERSLRKYMPLSFEPPVTAKEKQMFATSPKNIYEGDDLKIDIMQRGSVGKVNFTIKDFISQEVKSKNFSLNDDVVKEGQITLKTTGLTQGDYALEIKGPDTLIHNFSILPKFDVKERAAKLLKIGNHISSGSLATLQFNLQEVAGGLAKLSKYDDGANLRFKMVKINLAIKNGLTGKDYLADNPGTGVARRAYRSGFDNTLQPYSLALPGNYDVNKKYPLLIWLHGSGVDDRNAQTTIGYFAQGDVIGLAPNGRGPTTAYTRDHSQMDIKEVIEEVCQDYSVDKKNIILCGFSMGGYGVYRSFYETRDRYKALAIFSGHPNLSYGDIDFLKQENYEIFKGQEMFIFHGDLDRNCPIEKTLNLVEKLKAAGANVEFHLEKGVGHSQPGPEIQMAFKRWLEKRTASE